MALADILTGLKVAAETVVDRVYAFPSDRIEAPAIVLPHPSSDYEIVLSSGNSFEWTFSLWLFIAKADDRGGSAEFLPYLEPIGPQSIRQAILADRTLGGACDSVSVLSVRPVVATVAGTDYFAAEFTLHIIGDEGIPAPTPPTGDRIFYVNDVEIMRVTEIGLGIGTPTPGKRLSIRGITDASYISDSSAEFLSGVNGDRYAYSDFGFSLWNPLNPTPIQGTLSFGAEGVLNDVGDPTGYNLFLYDNVIDQYLFQWNPTELGFYVRAAFGGVNASPHASAQVDVQSTTRGFLPPRMTTAQRNAIVAPAEGLMIYNLTTHKLNVFTTVWEQVTSV
jgi:hypothetical protein